MSKVSSRPDRWKVLAFLLALLAIAPPSAHAYLDGGTGSMILQLLMAGVGGIVVMLRLKWRGLFGSKSSQEKKPAKENKQ
jgi:hypothetical protein